MTRDRVTELAEDAYEDAMDGGDDRLSKAVDEYMAAMRERAFEIIDDGGDGEWFIEHLHGNIEETFRAGL